LRRHQETKDTVRAADEINRHEYSAADPEKFRGGGHK